MDFETKFYSAGVPLAATVHIPDRDNREIAGRELVKVPDGIACSTEKYPAVILCHGNARHRDDGLDRLAQVLGEKGIASLRFDARGCGKDAPNKYKLRMATEMPYDMKCAIDYCESLPFVDRSRIGMSGISMGGMLTVRSAGGGEMRIKSAAIMGTTAISARGRRRRLGDKKFEEIEEMLREDARITAATGYSRIVNRITFMGGQNQSVADANVLEALMIPANNAYATLESIRDGNTFNTLKYAKNVRCPIFVIHGAEDELVAVSDAYDIFNTIPADNPNKRIRIYEDVDHNIPICKNREIVFRDIADWFAETL